LTWAEDGWGLGSRAVEQDGSFTRCTRHIVVSAHRFVPACDPPCLHHSSYGRTCASRRFTFWHGFLLT